MSAPKTLTGVVAEVTTAYTRVACAGAPGHLENQIFVNGSINQVPTHLRVVGTPVDLRYQSTSRYSLWFVRPLKNPPPKKMTDDEHADAARRNSDAIAKTKW